MLPFLDSPLLGTRKAAIRALAKLGGEHYTREFLAALVDAHPGVSTEATRALATSAACLTERFRSLFQTESLPHVRKNLFMLLTRQPFWPLGVFLFEAMRDRDEQIVELGRREFRNWLERSRNMATPPSASQARQLHNALRASTGMLEPQDISGLEFCLRAYN